VLIEAVKEQQQEIADLQANQKSLEERVAALEAGK
jgi:cell division protein FtsB